MEFNGEKFRAEKAEIEADLARLAAASASPGAFSGAAGAEFVEKSRKLAEINATLELGQKLENARKGLQEAQELVDDAELGEMALEDIKAYTGQIEALEAELEEKLLPRDPNDEKPAIMEIRAGRGEMRLPCSRGSCIGCMYGSRSGMGLRLNY